MSLLRAHDRPGSRRAARGVALIAIAGLHGLAIAVALAARGPQPDTPPRVESFEVLLFEPAAPAPALAPAVQPPLESPALPPPVLPLVHFEQPVEAPRAIQVAAAVVADAPAAPAVPGVAGEADVPVEVAEPDYLHRPPAVYPPAAKRVRAEGQVLVRALVGIDGHARDVTVHRSSGHVVLDRAACEWVRAIVFRPHRINGVARSMLVIVPVDYSLQKRHRQADTRQL